MSTHRFSKTALALFAGLTLVACGGTDPKPTDSGETGPLLPLAEGNVWEYRVTDAAGIISQKRTTVYAKEAVGGTGPNAAVVAFKVVTRKGSDLNVEVGLDKTESWQDMQDGVPERIIRYRELSYGAMTQLLQLDEHWDPPRIRVDGTDEHTKTGVNWLERYKETKAPADDSPMTNDEVDLWRVESADETVTVAGEKYEHTLHVIKTSDGGNGNVKEYWFKRGVGKVKEIASSQTEELVKYTPGSGATP